MEMRSIVGSLRDEQRVLELAINEKQNQIKHKEAEIQDLKSSLQTPPKFWSVSSIDPSKPTINLTTVVINSDVKVQKPKDEKLAGSKHYRTDAKIDMKNATYGINDGQNGNGLSQRDKSLITKNNEKSQLKANLDEGLTEVHQEANKTRSETDRMDEDEAEADTEADLDSSRNVSEADQDYKEETEE